MGPTGNKGHIMPSLGEEPTKVAPRASSPHYRDIHGITTPLYRESDASVGAMMHAVAWGVKVIYLADPLRPRLSERFRRTAFRRGS